MKLKLALLLTVHLFFQAFGLLGTPVWKKENEIRGRGTANESRTSFLESDNLLPVTLEDGSGEEDLPTVDRAFAKFVTLKPEADYIPISPKPKVLPTTQTSLSVLNLPSKVSGETLKHERLLKGVFLKVAKNEASGLESRVPKQNSSSNLDDESNSQNRLQTMPLPTETPAEDFATIEVDITDGERLLEVEVHVNSLSSRNSKLSGELMIDERVGLLRKKETNFNDENIPPRDPAVTAFKTVTTDMSKNLETTPEFLDLDDSEDLVGSVRLNVMTAAPSSPEEEDIRDRKTSPRFDQPNNEVRYDADLVFLQKYCAAIVGAILAITTIIVLCYITYSWRRRSHFRSRSNANKALVQCRKLEHHKGGKPSHLNYSPRSALLGFNETSLLETPGTRIYPKRMTTSTPPPPPPPLPENC